MKFVIKTAAAAVLFLMCGLAVAGEAKRPLDAIDYAYYLCKVMNKTGMTTECEVRGGNFSVDVTIDTSGSEARKICAGVADQMATVTRVFKDEWKLRILSPYSGTKAIAVCTLH